MISAHDYQSNRKTSPGANKWLEWENMSANGCIVRGRLPLSTIKMKEAYGQWQNRAKYLKECDYTIEVKCSRDWIEQKKDTDIKQFLLDIDFREYIISTPRFFWLLDQCLTLILWSHFNEKILHLIFPACPLVWKRTIYIPPLIQKLSHMISETSDNTLTSSTVKSSVWTNAFFCTAQAYHCKIKFALCRFCAEEQHKGPCTHSDEGDVWRAFG